MNTGICGGNATGGGRIIARGAFNFMQPAKLLRAQNVHGRSGRDGSKLHYRITQVEESVSLFSFVGDMSRT